MQLCDCSSLVCGDLTAINNVFLSFRHCPVSGLSCHSSTDCSGSAAKSSLHRGWERGLAVVIVAICNYFTVV